MIFFRNLHYRVISFKKWYLLLPCFLYINIGVSQNTRTDLSIRNEESINTKTLEYSPVLYKEKLIFTSTRPTAGSPMTKWRNEKEQFSDLYIAEKSVYGGFYNAQRLPGKASSPVHDGTATFNPAGTEMFFTRSNKNGKNKSNVINLKIYSAQLVNNVWQNMQEVPINDEEFSNCHPSLSPDGLSLYFASNRPGGFGGMDIYVSKKINGVWQHPKNLGPAVNSENNELFPFISNSGNLYFATNKQPNFGGLDIYKAVLNQDTEEFETANNLGPEFNSSGDDFGFCANKTEKEGYFSSNRKGGKGGDDIYFWQQNEIEIAPEQLRISIYDARSNERIPAATVTVFDDGVASTKNDVYPIAKMVKLVKNEPNNPYLFLQRKDYQTGSKGEISMIINQEKSYTIFVEKEGFLPLKKIITAKELAEKKRWDLQLIREAGIPLRIKAINMPFREQVPFVTLELLNKCTEQVERAISDESGNFVFYLACGCDYELVGKKDAFRNYKKKFSTKYRNCGNLNAINTQLYLVKQEVIKNIAETENLRFPSFESFYSQNIRKVGQVIVLDKITFEENKANLLPSTLNEIQKLLYLLQQYPEISVEISAHTDARGTAKFNHRLSQERADAIVQFLLDKKVPKEQISAKGYGEDKLLNRCQDGVRCEEFEHQANKRIEMKILKIKTIKVENLLGQR